MYFTSLPTFFAKEQLMARTVEIKITTDANLAELNGLANALSNTARDLTTFREQVELVDKVSRDAATGIKTISTSVSGLAKSLSGASPKLNETAQAINALRESVLKFSTEEGKVDDGFKGALETFTKITTQIKETSAAIKGLSTTAKTSSEGMKSTDTATKDMAADINKLSEEAIQARADFMNWQRELGGTTSALNKVDSAQKQYTETMQRVEAAQQGVAKAEATLDRAEQDLNELMLKGNATTLEKQRVLEQYNQALTQARAARTSLMTAEKQADTEEQNLLNTTTSLLDKRTAAENALNSGMIKSEETQQRYSAMLVNIEGALPKVAEVTNQWASSEKDIDTALGSANTAIDRALEGRAKLASITTAAASAEGKLSSSSLTLSNSVAALTRPFAAVMTSLNNFVKVIGGAIINALKSASSAVGSFANMAASGFARARGALDDIGKGFSMFGIQVKDSMETANKSVMDFYASGWSLLMAGSQVKNVGQQIASGMTSGLGDFMDYEKNLTRTGISAGAENSQGVREIEDFIQNIASGRGGTDQPAVRGFSMTDLAQGVYFFTSALGTKITQDNMKQVQTALVPVLQMASATQTSPEEAIKGVLNMMMENGLDPRQIAEGNQAAADEMAKAAAQIGYLANISTMEVPDIVETFKMMGPMIHLLTGDQAGAGLSDSMVLAYLGSEMGLRGGNLGRGLSQVGTTLLKPPDAMVERASKALNIPNTQEAFHATFFDEQGHLKGGFEGLVKTLAGASDQGNAAQVLANIFTTNATRAMIPQVIKILQDPNIIDDIRKEIESGKPGEWLNKALALTNDTIFANFQNLKNAWFAVQTEIIRAIEGPLKAALFSIADTFWTVAKTIENNPWIGKLIVSIASLSAGILTAVGSLMMIGGSILIAMRAFTMLAGAMPSVIMFFGAVVQAGLILVPLLAALAVAGGVLYEAWTKDFMGIHTAWNNFTENFSIETTVIPAVEHLVQVIAVFGKAFMEFINGIILGSGETKTLGIVLQEVFGTVVGRVLYSALRAASAAFDPLRQKISDFISMLTQGGGFVSAIKGASSAIAEFFDMLIGGKVTGGAAAGAMNFGKLLGIDNLPAIIKGAALTIRGGLDTIFGYVQQFVGQVGKVLGGIGNDLKGLFTVDNLRTFLDLLKALATGFGEGLAGGILGALNSIKLLTDQLSKLGTWGSALSDYINQWLGFRVTLEDIAQAIGIAIGLWLGTKLVASLTPGIDIIAKIALGVANVGLAMGEGLVKVGGWLTQGALWIAQMAVQATMMAAQLTTLGLVTLAKLALAASSGAAALAETAQAAATGTLTAVMAGLLSTLLAITAVLAGWALAMGGIAVLLAGLAAALVIVDGATNGWQSALSDVVALWDGFSGVIKIFLGIVGDVIGQLAGVVGQIGDMIVGLGLASDKFEAIGKAIAIFAVAAVAPFVLIGTVIAAVVLAIAGIGVIIVKVAAVFVDAIKGMIDFVTHLQDAWNNLGQAFQKVGALFQSSVVDSLKAQYADLKKQHDDYIQSFAGTDLQAAQSEADRKLAEGGIQDSGYADYIKQRQQELAAQREKEWAATVGGMKDMYTAGGEKVTLDPLQAVQFQINQEEAKQKATQAGTEAAQAVAKPLSTSFLDDLQGMLKGLGVDDSFNNFLTGMGLDPKTMDATQLKSAIDKWTQQYGGSLGVSGDQIDKDYQALIAKHHEVTTNFANSATKDTGYAFDTVAEQTRKDAAVAAQKIQDAHDNFIKQFTQAAAKPSVGQAIAAIFDPPDLEKKFGEGTKTIADLLTQSADGVTSNADTIVKNVLAAFDKIRKDVDTQLPKHLSITDIFMEAMAGGVHLDKGALGGFGQNVKTALEPLANEVAKQYGISAQGLLKGVQAFNYDKDVLPVAEADLLAAMQKVPTDLLQKINTMGAGDFTRVGIKWDSIAKYAISKGMEGEHWNLETYMEEKWNMSKQKAETYLQSHGIDPNVITDAMFPDVQDQIDSAGGKIAVIAEDAWAFVTKHVDAANNKIIDVTRAQFDQLPTLTKIALTNMGYAFVIGTDSVVHSAQKGAAQIAGVTTDEWNAMKDSAGQAGTDAANALTVNFEDGTSKTFPDKASYDAFFAPAITAAGDAGLTANGDFMMNLTNIGADNKTVTVDTTAIDNMFGPIKDAAGTAGTEAGTNFFANITGNQTPISIPTDNITTAIQPAVDAVSGAGTDAGTAFKSSAAAGVAGVGTDVATKATTELSGVTIDKTTLDSQFVLVAQSATSSFSVELMKQLPPVIQNAFEALNNTNSTYGGSGNISQGPNPIETIFIGWADKAATAFETEIRPKISSIIEQAVSGGAAVAGGGAPTTGGGAAAGPEFTNMQNWASLAAMKFGDALGADLPSAIQNAITLATGGAGQTAGIGSGGQAAAGPFDAMFTGYAQSALFAFGNELTASLPDTINNAINSANTGGGTGQQTGGLPSTSGPFSDRFTTMADGAIGAFSQALNLEPSVEAAISVVTNSIGPNGTLYANLTTAFKTAADGAATTFGDTLNTLVGPKIEAVVSGTYVAKGDTGGGGSAAGPDFNNMKNWAQIAANAFGDALQTDIPVAITQAFQLVSQMGAGAGISAGNGKKGGGAAAGGPLDTQFQGYGQSAAAALGQALTDNLQPAIDGAITDQVKGAAFTDGYSIGHSMSDGITSSLKEIGASLGKIQNLVNTSLGQAIAGAFSYGYGLGHDFAKGIDSSIGEIDKSTQKVSDSMPHSPAKRGPLSRPISFQYIPDEMTRAFGTLPSIADEHLGALRGRIDKLGGETQGDLSQLVTSLNNVDRRNRGLNHQQAQHTDDLIKLHKSLQDTHINANNGDDKPHITVNFDNVTITKEADVDALVERVNNLAGRQIELTRRGQRPVDGMRRTG